jgi:polar amino acid transport system permease protein
MPGRSFGWNEFLYLLKGVEWTLGLSGIAFLGGGFLGMLAALAQISRIRLMRLLATLYVQLIQSTPLLILLFIAYFGFTLIGVDVPALVAAAVALVLYSGAFLGEIWRGCLEAVPRAQWVTADALGLTRSQLLFYVIVPQAARIALPPTVGFLVQIVKNTSLCALVGFIELTRAGQLIHNVTFQPAPVFGTVALLYFAICFPLSLISRRLEVKFNAGRTTLRSA